MKRYETVFLSAKGRMLLYQPSGCEEGNMDHITLQEVDESNSPACLSLKLEAQQEKFISHPTRSLIQMCVYYSQCTPFAVYHAGQVVRYLMVICNYDEETYFIWRLMVDAQHQDRNCGKAAMETAPAYIRSKPFEASNLVRLAVSSEDAAACHLYQTLRSSLAGRADGDEIELERVLD